MKFKTFHGVTETLDDAVLEADIASSVSLGVIKIGEKAVYSSGSPRLANYVPRPLIQGARYIHRPFMCKT